MFIFCLKHLLGIIKLAAFFFLFVTPLLLLLLWASNNMRFLTFTSQALQFLYQKKFFFFFLLLVVVAMTHRKHTHLYASKFMRRFALIIYGWMCGGRSTCKHYAAQCARTCCTLPQTFTLIFKKGTRTLKNVSGKHVKLIVVNYSWREQRGDARAGIFIFFLFLLCWGKTDWMSLQL